jgi:hypothetical protein
MSMHFCFDMLAYDFRMILLYPLLSFVYILAFFVFEKNIERFFEKILLLGYVCIYMKFMIVPFVLVSTSPSSTAQ